MNHAAYTTRHRAQRPDTRMVPSSLPVSFLPVSFLRVASLRMLPLALLLAVMLASAPRAAAQKPIDIGMSYIQERAKFVGPSSNDFFRLRGAAVDVSYDAWHGLGPVASASGLSATNLRYQIDIHQVSLMGGARYTYNRGHITPTAWGRKSGIFLQGLAGYTFATSGLYPTNAQLSDHSTGLAYMGGGGLNLNIFHRFDVRVFEADYVQTHLSNGGTNQQNNLRLSAGVNFHLGY